MIKQILVVVGGGFALAMLKGFLNRPIPLEWNIEALKYMVDFVAVAFYGILVWETRENGRSKKEVKRLAN